MHILNTLALHTQVHVHVCISFCFLTGNPAHLYRAQDKQKCIHVTLLYSDNSSGLNSADKIKSMSSVGATQITLTQDSKHHLLTLHLDSNGMESLWKVVCGSAGSGIHAGLLALRLEGGVTVWLSSQNIKGDGADRQTAQSQERSGTGEWMNFVGLAGWDMYWGSTCVDNNVV